MKNIPVRHIEVQKEPGFSGSFNIRDVKLLLERGKLVQGLHRHDYYFILALKKGTGSHEIDFTPYEVGDNSVFFMRPGQVHQLVLEAGSEGYLLQFDANFYYTGDELLAHLLRRAGNSNYCRLEAGDFKKLSATLQQVLTEYTERKEGYAEVIKALLGIFFIELLRNRQNTGKTINQSYTQERMAEFIELLETNLTTHKPVSYYADTLNMSVYRLNAITKEGLGKTCSDVINDRIILEVKRQLLATPALVNEIAYHLGYDDVSYFIRFFKNHTGQTPEAYRANLK